MRPFKRLKQRRKFRALKLLLAGIPRKIYLSDGKEGERTFVDKIIDKGETGVWTLLIFSLEIDVIF